VSWGIVLQFQQNWSCRLLRSVVRQTTAARPGGPAVSNKSKSQPDFIPLKPTWSNMSSSATPTPSIWRIRETRGLEGIAKDSLCAVASADVLARRRKNENLSDLIATTSSEFDLVKTMYFVLDIFIITLYYFQWFLFLPNLHMLYSYSWVCVSKWRIYTVPQNTLVTSDESKSFVQNLFTRVLAVVFR